MNKIFLMIAALVVLMPFTAIGANAQNLVTNPSFEVPDPRVPIGTTYTSVNYGYTAATNWNYADNGDRTVPHSTQLTNTTLPEPDAGLNMICVTTSGPSDGLFQYFLPSGSAGVNQATYRVWVKVTSGRIYIGGGRAGGIYSTVRAFSVPGNTDWQLLEVNSGANFVTGVFIYTSTASAQFCAENVSVTAPACPDDTDGDGLADCTDPDDDNDTVLDGDDAFPLDPAESVDTDGDSIGNNADADDDGDGQSDADEIACGSDPLDRSDKSDDLDNDNIPDCVDSDDDGDGVSDGNDNCRVNANPSQADFDGDGIGDACEVGPVRPTNKDQCKNDGWMFWAPRFKNQGDCIQFVETGK